MGKIWEDLSREKRDGNDVTIALRDKIYKIKIKYFLKGDEKLVPILDTDCYNILSNLFFPSPKKPDNSRRNETISKSMPYQN